MTRPTSIFSAACDLVIVRRWYRLNRKFHEADSIKQFLLAYGVEIEDSSLWDTVYDVSKFTHYECEPDEDCGKTFDHDTRERIFLDEAWKIIEPHNQIDLYDYPKEATC